MSRKRCRSDGNLRGATMRTAMGTYHLRPFGQPCIEGFFGGRFAQELEDAGDGALAAQSIDEIAGFLGNDYRRKLKPLAESRWAHDPFARGSYSHALPGHAGTRAVLAAPVDGRCSSPAKPPRRIFSRRRMGRGIAGSGRRGRCWRRSREASSVSEERIVRRNSSFRDGAPAPDSEFLEVRCFASPRNDNETASNFTPSPSP